MNEETEEKIICILAITAIICGGISLLIFFIK